MPDSPPVRPDGCSCGLGPDVHSIGCPAYRRRAETPLVRWSPTIRVGPQAAFESERLRQCMNDCADKLEAAAETSGHPEQMLRAVEALRLGAARRA